MVIRIHWPLWSLPGEEGIDLGWVGDPGNLRQGYPQSNLDINMFCFGRCNSLNLSLFSGQNSKNLSLSFFFLTRVGKHSLMLDQTFGWKSYPTYPFYSTCTKRTFRGDPIEVWVFPATFWWHVKNIYFLLAGMWWHPWTVLWFKRTF